MNDKKRAVCAPVRTCVITCITSCSVLLLCVSPHHWTDGPCPFYWKRDVPCHSHHVLVLGEFLLWFLYGAKLYYSLVILLREEIKMQLKLCFAAPQTEPQQHVYNPEVQDGQLRVHLFGWDEQRFAGLKPNALLLQTLSPDAAAWPNSVARVFS